MILFAQESVKIANKQWAKAINKRKSIVDLGDYYFSKACLLSPKGEKEIKVYTEFTEHFNSLSSQFGKVKKINTLHAVQDKNGNILELGIFKSKENKNFAYVTAWHYDNGKLKKEVHLVYPINNTFYNSAKNEIYNMDINQARSLWMEFSNSHMPSKLLKVLYTKDALYFNQGKLYDGFEEIDPKYAYMSNKNWKIKLYADKVLQISENLALEIGHYLSSGKGHYIIVWEKNEEEMWQVKFDFNF